MLTRSCAGAEIGGGSRGIGGAGGPVIGTGIGAALSQAWNSVYDTLMSTSGAEPQTSAGEADQVHGNSARSPRETDLYYLINRDSGEIDKIGITQYPGYRYPQSYLDAENVRYETQITYSSRYPAMVDENIRLYHYRLEHGELPRLNKTTR